MQGILEAIEHATMISGFVFIMMLAVEYFNVSTRGLLQRGLVRGRWRQYLLAVALGSMPGCLGAFVSVTLYAHGVFTLGAVTAAMIATSGDAAYVMFAMVPEEAFLVAGALAVLGVATGFLTDSVPEKWLPQRDDDCHRLEVHEEDRGERQNLAQIIAQWKRVTPARLVLAGGIAAYFVLLLSRTLGDEETAWVRWTLAGSAVAGLFIVVTVPDHFLAKHLWEHVAKRHFPRIFAWTLGALLVVYLVVETWGLGDELSEGRWALLLASGVVGLIPDSAPHIVFITLYAEQIAPFSVLLASSIVQDGHGMLPMLAHSRRAFIRIKLINLVVGLAVGACVMAFGR